MGVIAGKHGSLTSPPLVYSLIMLRFPEQASLDSSMPDIQDALKADYPIFDKRFSQGIEIVQRPDGQTLSTNSVPEYMFFDEHRDKGILLKSDRIIFHSTIYPGFPEFSRWFREAAQKIVSIQKIAHFVGIGIRYVDVIKPEPANGEKLSDYLVDSLRPFDLDAGEATELNVEQQLFVFGTSLGSLVFKKHYLPKSDICYPPDLRDLSSVLRAGKRRVEGPFAVLDFDHNYVVPDSAALPLQMDELVSRIDDMHTLSSRAFLSAIKPEAILRWQ